MSDALSNLFGAILAILLLIIAPILLFATSTESATQTYVTTITTEFVDEVREVGYLSPLMYERFMNQLDSTKIVYQVEIIHKKRVIFSEALPPVVATGGGVAVVTGGGVAATPEATWSPNDFYFDFYQSEELLKTLYPVDESISLLDRYYRFERGDYIEVKVYNEQKTLATRLMQSLTGATYHQSIHINYGGMIRNKG